MRNKKPAIWQKGIEIFKKIFQLKKRPQSEETYSPISELVRAAASVSATIAHKSHLQKDREYSELIQLSLGSAFEVQAYLVIAQDVDLVSNAEVQVLEDLSEREIIKLHHLLNTQITMRKRLAHSKAY
jgi:four helix bundle protein